MKRTFFFVLGVVSRIALLLAAATVVYTIAGALWIAGFGSGPDASVQRTYAGYANTNLFIHLGLNVIVLSLALVVYRAARRIFEITRKTIRLAAQVFHFVIRKEPRPEFMPCGSIGQDDLLEITQQLLTHRRKDALPILSLGAHFIHDSRVDSRHSYVDIEIRSMFETATGYSLLGSVLPERLMDVVIDTDTTMTLDSMG